MAKCARRGTAPCRAVPVAAAVPYNSCNGAATKGLWWRTKSGRVLSGTPPSASSAETGLTPVVMTGNAGRTGTEGSSFHGRRREDDGGGKEGDWKEGWGHMAGSARERPGTPHAPEGPREGPDPRLHRSSAPLLRCTGARGTV
ncbi:hypothetical protein CMUS01_01363 [Colletotrichum musicola]|uniref:Uncharacterized protein n=1 Tax=Colletotrichum musicola TaxID=2175873 RepID=A0A8H6U864_9PEZI|nr:hypothetical protein CMUS01_01363 [Colletotrichum musicola]